MVLGLRSKNRRGTSVQVDYIIHIEEIKPWPPSQSLKSLRSVVLQWENGDRNTGSTSPVAPSIGQGKIEFNESFKLQVTLLKESSGKGSDFQKNVLELNLYEPRRDKTVKGQLLGSAVVDLAEHGIVKEITSFAAPVNCKRSFRNTAQPMLYVRIQPLDREGSSSSSRESLSKEASLDKDGRESVSALMSEEYAEEAEFASFTDDDVSSHSSLTNSPGEQAPHESTSEALDGNTGEQNLETDIPPKPMPAEVDLKPVTSASALSVDSIHQNGSLPLPLLADLSIDSENLNNGDVPVCKAPQMSSTLVLDKPDTPSTHSSSSLVSYAGIEETRHSNFSEGFEKIDLNQEAKEKMADCRSEENVVDNPLEEENNMNALLDRKSSNLYQEELNSASTADPEQNVGDKFSLKTRDGSNKVVSVVEESVEEVQHHSMEMECPSDSPPNKTSIASVAGSEYTLLTLQHRYLQNALRKPASPDTIMSAQKVLNEGSTRILTNDKLKNMRLSMRSSQDSLGSIRRTTSDQYREDVKEIDVLEDIHKGGAKLVTNGVDEQELTSLISENVKHVSRFNRNSFSNNKVRELELRVEMLEGELREAAAIEIGLYSIIAEHGSSAHKVHTPARRLSRLYLHALKEWSQERKAGAARSIVSGLVLVAKACGNDVPRLTYWLSNSVVLRAIVTQAIGQSDPPKSAVPHNRANGSGMMATGKSSPLKWESTYHKKEKFSEEYEDWEDPCTFVAALDKTEAWIFSRIIESVWWETLTPHMQSAIQGSEQSTGSCLKKKFGKKPSVGDQQQATLSIETWKNAFKDACERLCPVRGGGHECGCLPMLARLVMEQCVARLDVAMFNAILRESDDEIPTDPVSDPVSDPKVLPIPPGKSSFGAGAQLKNAIGNWSRWLTDLFGMDVDDSPQDEKDQDDDRLDVAASFKSFHLLNALSDLLMLPKDMLLETSIRKEVCPTFSASMIKRILSSFLPDEFCPDPIPEDLLEALDSEDPLESGNEAIRNFPCNASPIIYSLPSVTSIEIIFGDVRSAFALGRSRSSVVRKGHTSDDELDELDSPLSSIVIEKSSTPTPRWMGNRNANAVRYQLLRDVWRNDD